MVSMASLPGVIGLLDQDCRYKSVATQIPHDAELEQIQFAGEIKLGTAACERVILPLSHKDGVFFSVMYSLF